MDISNLGPWKAFAEQLPAVRCSPGHLIYLQGTEPTCFYYLRQGQVKSFIQSSDGAERVLNLYPQGSVFGEAAFFDGLPRMSSAVALTACQLVPMGRDVVKAAVAREPELAMAMLQYLARTVRMLSDQVDEMAFRPADQRVARYLLSLPRSPDGSVSCTQEEIASCVSASRITVSRTLSAFARRGWLRTGYGQVRLIRPEELERLGDRT